VDFDALEHQKSCIGGNSANCRTKSLMLIRAGAEQSCLSPYLAPSCLSSQPELELE
jgi:hypothetical protein